MHIKRETESNEVTPKFQQLVTVPNPEICEQVEALDNEGS